MGVITFEASKKVKVRRMKQAGRIVCHFVRNPRLIIMPRHVSMVALMTAKQPKKVCRGRIGCASTFALLEHGVDAISFAYNSSLSDVIEIL